MAGTDDPLFLELIGPGGREFRLAPAKGKALQRGSHDEFVLAGPGDPGTNVAHPELNDPTQPPLDATLITGACLRKGTEPIPNVRGFGEMDDRVQLLEATVDLHIDAEPEARRFQRQGPVWLGLVCGQRVNLTQVALS
jgi:hypothetical protein